MTKKAKPLPFTVTPETVKLVNKALGLERDRLRRKLQHGSEAIQTYLTSASDESKCRLHYLLSSIDAPATAEPELPNGRHAGMFAVSAVTNIEIDKITNAIVGAIENGYSPWMHSFLVNSDDVSTRLSRPSFDGERMLWYVDPRFWQSGGKAVVTYDLPTGDEGAGQAVIGIEELSKGLATMASKFARHFADLKSENDDAETHDVFMQCVILGDVVYG